MSIEISIGDAILFHNLIKEEIRLLQRDDEKEEDNDLSGIQGIIENRFQTVQELLEKIKQEQENILKQESKKLKS